MTKHREKFIIALLGMMMIFFCTFTISLIALKNHYSLFAIGIPYSVENWLIITLSLIFIVKIIHEMVIN